MNHQPFRHQPWPPRQEPHEHVPALFRQALAGPPRFSARLLDAFDAPEALALARQADDAHNTTQALRQLQRELAESAHPAAMATPAPRPLPLLLLDADAEPALLLPLLLWRPAGQSHRAGLRGVATLATPSGCPQLPPPRRAGWHMTVLQARAMLHTVAATLPQDTDLLLCHALPPAAAPDDALLRQLLTRTGHDILPGCATAHPLSWRGMLALLRARLRTLPLPV